MKKRKHKYIRFHNRCNNVNVYRLNPDGSQGKLLRVEGALTRRNTPVHKHLIGENGMKRLLDKMIDSEPVDNIRPDWLTNPKTGYPLELDRYYPELKLAFEFQGEQHYRSFPDSNLKSQKYRDRIKRDKCRSLGIALIYVHNSTLDKDLLRSKIDKQCPGLLQGLALLPSQSK